MNHLSQSMDLVIGHQRLICLDINDMICPHLPISLGDTICAAGVAGISHYRLKTRSFNAFREQ